MTAATEVSLGMLKEADFTDDLDRPVLDKKFQGKCLAFVSHCTPSTVLCFVIIAILIENAILVPILLSVRMKEPVIEKHLFATCPKDWIGFGNKCFYFSEDTRNWTSSQRFCASFEANLAHFENTEELDFLKRYKGLSDHWVGLGRESAQQMWEWTDGSTYQDWFSIRGAGECAYLNDNGLSSARVYTERKWICSKHSSYALQCPVAIASASLYNSS